MKRCPYCAEKIQEAAVVCRYCGRELPAAEVPGEVEASSRLPGASLTLGIVSVAAILLPTALGALSDFFHSHFKASLWTLTVVMAFYLSFLVIFLLPLCGLILGIIFNSRRKKSGKVYPQKLVSINRTGIILSGVSLVLFACISWILPFADSL